MPLNNINGLKSEHRVGIVLYEKTYIPPRIGNKQVSRLYTDGSYYLLGDAGSWIYISKLTKTGLQDMKKVIGECCLLEEGPGETGNHIGAVIWELLCENNYRKITVEGIPEGSFLAFQKIEKILNTGMQTIPSDNN